MNEQDFQGIVAGLGDAIAFVKGDRTKGRVAAGPDVKAIRAKTKLRRSSPRSCTSPSPPCAIGNNIVVRPTPRRERCLGWWMLTRSRRWR